MPRPTTAHAIDNERKDNAIALLVSQAINLKLVVLRVSEAARDYRMRDLLYPALDELEQAEALRLMTIQKIRDL